MKTSKADDDTALLDAHVHCRFHRAEIQRSDICGCFYCLRTFTPTAILDWVDDDSETIVITRATGQTARCPHCGIDSVLGSASQFPITPDFLVAMRKHWFETPWPMPEERTDD